MSASQRYKEGLQLIMDIHAELSRTGVPFGCPPVNIDRFMTLVEKFVRHNVIAPGAVCLR